MAKTLEKTVGDYSPGHNKSHWDYDIASGKWYTQFTDGILKLGFNNSKSHNSESYDLEILLEHNKMDPISFLYSPIEKKAIEFVPGYTQIAAFELYPYLHHIENGDMSPGFKLCAIPAVNHLKDVAEKDGTNKVRRIVEEYYRLLKDEEKVA
tara:strand:- start:3473 stop:3928 length:456 start_codon:yes stop_codon:yes gene_type:complete